jgi:hypothetical protein
MPPIVIAAGVAGAAGIGAAVLGGSAQKSAAKSAANSAAATAASNNALQTQVRNDNKAILNPYVTRGNEAGQAINDLLGISGTGGSGSNVDWAAYVNANPDAAANWNAVRGNSDGAQFNGDINAFGQYHYGADGSRRDLTPFTRQPGGSGEAGGAFQNYLNSTGYQFQMDQGTSAINQGYAAGGTLQSGAALKALQTYGQNTGKAYFNDYLGQLGNQQNIGLSGANALAGVGTNFANQTSANNNAAGTAQQNALLAAGSATAGMYGSIAGGIGGIANAYASSYRPQVG